MGLHEGRGTLAKAMKELLARWADARGSWRDAMAERFEKERLLPLEADLKNAISAMDHMASVLNQVRKDCE